MAINSFVIVRNILLNKINSEIDPLTYKSDLCDVITEPEYNDIEHWMGSHNRTMPTVRHKYNMFIK